MIDTQATFDKLNTQQSHNMSHTVRNKTMYKPGAYGKRGDLDKSGADDGQAPAGPGRHNSIHNTNKKEFDFEKVVSVSPEGDAEPPVRVSTMAQQDKANAPAE